MKLTVAEDLESESIIASRNSSIGCGGEKLLSNQPGERVKTISRERTRDGAQFRTISLFRHLS
jgi:hypothetical protein